MLEKCHLNAFDTNDIQRIILMKTTDEDETTNCSDNGHGSCDNGTGICQHGR